jgi:hypothetical protein
LIFAKLDQGLLDPAPQLPVAIGTDAQYDYALPPRPGAIDFVINDHCMGLAPLQAADEGCETEAC